MKRLQGQTAVVTGSSSGLGQGIAIEMGKEGANVCINTVSTPHTQARDTNNYSLIRSIL